MHQVLPGEQPAGNQHPYAKETRISLLRHTSKLPRTYCRVKNLSWEKAWLLGSPELSGTRLSPHNSFEPQQPNAPFIKRLPSVVPCTTPDYTHKAPAFLTHLWEHLGTEDRTTALCEQTHGQLQLQTMQVSPSLYRNNPMDPTLPVTHPTASPTAGMEGEAHLAAPHTALLHFMVEVTQEQESSFGALQSPKRCKPDVKKTTLPGEMIPRDSPQPLFAEASRWFSFCYMSVSLMAGCKRKERIAEEKC